MPEVTLNTFIKIVLSISYLIMHTMFVSNIFLLFSHAYWVFLIFAFLMINRLYLSGQITSSDGIIDKKGQNSENALGGRPSSIRRGRNTEK